MLADEMSDRGGVAREWSQRVYVIPERSNGLV
jgi:hypothetical protein